VNIRKQIVNILYSPSEVAFYVANLVEDWG